MKSVFGHTAARVSNAAGQKTGEKVFYKEAAQKARAGTLLAARWLSPAEVSSYLVANFENVWNHYDQNGEGWIRYEETHVFFRYLLGKLNRFTGAQGSISDASEGVDH